MQALATEGTPPSPGVLSDGTSVAMPAGGTSDIAVFSWRSWRSWRLVVQS